MAPEPVADTMPNFAHTGINSPVTEIGILLLSEKSGVYTSWGSGVIVGPGLAITARHVFDGLSRYYGEQEITPGTTQGVGFSLQAIQINENGTQGLSWSIRQIAVDEDTDIAFLTLQGTNEKHQSYKWRSFRMQLLPPRPGSVIAAFGYHHISTDFLPDGSLQTIAHPYSARGVVEEVHLTRRDAGLLHFPCFRTNARFDGGMSGGLVVSQEGLLCGLICSNLPPVSEDEHHVSYVSSLWLCMGTLLSWDRVGHPANVTYPAMDLVTGGILVAVDAEKVSAVRNPSTGCVTISADHNAWVELAIASGHSEKVGR